MTASALELKGTRLGPYELQDELGRGGMGSVYLARDTALDRQVAIKILPAELTRDQEYVDRFVREAQIAAKLNHPNVVQVYGAGFEKGLAYIAMELVPGGTLGDLASRLQPFPVRLACQVIRDAALALTSAHARQIVHRDIKPDNILFTPGGEVKLADFGLAYSHSSQRITLSGTYMGTPQYSSPEQCAAGDVAPSSDLYSLGVILYELLSGKTPHQAKTPLILLNRIISEPVPPLEEERAGLPSELLDLVRRLLEKDPVQRPASAAALVKELDRLLDTLPAEVTQVVVDSRPGMALVGTVRTSTSFDRVAETSVAPFAEGDPAGGPPLLEAAPQRKLGLKRLVAVGALLAGLLGAFYAWSPGVGEGRKPGRVVVLMWEPLPGTPSDFDWLAQAVPDFVQAELETLETHELQVREQLLHELTPGEDPGPVLAQHGVDFWVEGEYQERDGQVLIRTRVRGHHAAQLLGTAQRVFPKDVVLSELASLSLEVREAVAQKAFVSEPARSAPSAPVEVQEPWGLAVGRQQSPAEPLVPEPLLVEGGEPEQQTAFAPSRDPSENGPQEEPPAGDKPQDEAPAAKSPAGLVAARSPSPRAPSAEYLLAELARCSTELNGWERAGVMEQVKRSQDSLVRERAASVLSELARSPDKGVRRFATHYQRQLLEVDSE